MSIDDIRPDPVRNAHVGALGRVGRGGTPKIPGAQAVGRADRIEISERARELARSRDAEEAAGEELAPERAEVVRQRIRDGFYDSPDVMERVARALLESGDL